jgi:hypothetical protein
MKARPTRMVQIMAALCTTAFLAAALWSAGKTSGQRSDRSSPERCVETLMEAARRGDLETYLGCFDGSVRQRLTQQAQEQGRERFAAQLVVESQDVVGWAIRKDLSTVDQDRGLARVVVERVYRGRPWERQLYRLERLGRAWCIVELEPAELFQPPVPHGAVAFPDESPPKIEQPPASDREQTEQRGRQPPEGR